MGEATNYKIILQYDGTSFSGWQKQGNTKNTIQEKLESILSEMSGETVEIHGAGRTDAGVHAEGQVASFKLRNFKEPDFVKSYLNKYLPARICVTSAEIAENDFHARLSAKGKVYVYRVWNSDTRNVFEYPYLYHYAESIIDCGKMQKAADLLKGECDLASFCVPSQLKGYDKKGRSTVRRIDRIKVERIGEEVRMTFEGSGFLYNTVRIMAGTLIEIGIGQRSVESITETVKKRDRASAGFKAPACGLILKEVKY
ncbi:MAG: tRNA pseudouridine(38-40) synthase TruA [Ruminococcaceae bacterium]|nr:tRNA pseudouridine(38-40) synthase TruA [Oscillospiraceae bacterium]